MEKQNQNIRQVQKQGVRKVVSVPKELNLQIGDFVEILPVEIRVKKEVSN